MGGKASTITNTVKDARKAAGLSQQSLASAVRVTRQTIIALEANRYAPSLELAFRLSRTLGVPVETLFQFSGAWE